MLSLPLCSAARTSRPTFLHCLRTAGKAGGAKFAELCLRLPGLHAGALRLLHVLLGAARGQLAPLFLTTARLLAEYLGRVAAGGAGALTPMAPMVSGHE